MPKKAKAETKLATEKPVTKNNYLTTKAEQVKQKDQKWANKSWKPYLWMAIGGTVGFIVGFVLIMMPVVIIGTVEPETMTGLDIAFMVPGIILLVAGEFVTAGGVALMVVTMIKRNKARERLGLPKDN